MPQPDDFPPMVFMGVKNDPGLQRASIRELTPQFRRPPDKVWAQCFRIECEASPQIDWYGADFAKRNLTSPPKIISAESVGHDGPYILPAGPPHRLY